MRPAAARGLSDEGLKLLWNLRAMQHRLGADALLDMADGYELEGTPDRYLVTILRCLGESDPSNDSWDEIFREGCAAQVAVE